MLYWKDIIYYAKYSNPEPVRKVERSQNEWQSILTPMQYAILRQKGTEPPYRNVYCRSYEPGLYACAGCGSLIFSSTEKYYAISGWPSFKHPIAKGAIKYAFDNSYNMQRLEAICNVCDSHLGHVFSDGPQPYGLRYCINSESLIKLDNIA
jgi:peptide-methionine (R)-S-oxide reductase